MEELPFVEISPQLVAAMEQVFRSKTKAEIDALRAELRFCRGELRAELNDFRDRLNSSHEKSKEPHSFVAGVLSSAPTHMDTTIEVNKETIQRIMIDLDGAVRGIHEFRSWRRHVDACLAAKDMSNPGNGVEEEALTSERKDQEDSLSTYPEELDSDAEFRGTPVQECTEAVSTQQQATSNDDRSQCAVDRALEQAGKFRTYRVERNVYGLLVMPSRPLSSGAWLLLLIHYVFVFWLSASIHQATVEAGKESYGDIDGTLCTRVGDSWDCAEPLLKQMTDFELLDKNGDGKWSLKEAAENGLLLQFQALHAVAVESINVLKDVAQSVSEVPDPFCSLGLIVYQEYGAEFGWDVVVQEILAYLWEQNVDVLGAYFVDFHLLGPCVRRLYFYPKVGDAQVRLKVLGTYQNVSVHDILCLAELKCQDGLKGEPAQSSEDVYRKSTGYYAFFPKWMYVFLFKNLLQPCFLIDGEFCANAEIRSDFLRMVPRWKELSSAERVQQCTSYVNEVCPHILGDQFQTFAKDVSQSCGQREYETIIVSEASVSGGGFRGRIPCNDDDSALAGAMLQLRNSDPYVERLMTMMSLEGKVPTTCQQLVDEGWCSITVPVPGILQNTSAQNSFLGTFIARACPHSCCKDASMLDEPSLIFTPIGCDPRCYQAEDGDHGSAFHKACFGTGCNRFAFKEEQFGQLRISAFAGWYDNQESSIIRIYSNRSLRVNVINVFAGGGRDCPLDSLQIDGTKVCKENLHQNRQVFVPMRSRDSFDLIFYASVLSHCPSGGIDYSEDCKWEVVIVDAGERKEATISEVSFEQQIRFGITPQGVRSFNYVSFFSLILGVWVSFMWQELERIIKLLFFLLECPDVGDFRRRVFLLLTVGVPRFLIWGWVLWVGVILLIASTDFVEIVLNSLALGFILELDDILYGIMLPTSVQQVVVSIDPFRWRKTAGSSERFRDMRVFIMALLLLLFTVGVVTLEYRRPGGYLEIARQFDCVCDLQGPYCSSGVLN